MSDCNKEEKKWCILYYAYEDFNHENPIVEHFHTKEAAEERSKEIYERWRGLDRKLLDLVAEKLGVKP